MLDLGRGIEISQTGQVRRIANENVLIAGKIFALCQIVVQIDVELYDILHGLDLARVHVERRWLLERWILLDIVESVQSLKLAQRCFVMIILNAIVTARINDLIVALVGCLGAGRLE